MINESKINICQPGFNASCALCCGSHNYMLNQNEIEKIFKSRLINISSKNIDDILRRGEFAITEIYKKKYSDASQCKYVGYRNSSNTTIGCLVYNRIEEIDEDAKLFFRKTCKKFSCLAREILTDDEILFAAQLMADWFYYSLLINDIELLRSLVNKNSSYKNITADDKSKIKKLLLSKI